MEDTIECPSKPIKRLENIQNQIIEIQKQNDILMSQNIKLYTLLSENIDLMKKDKIPKPKADIVSKLRPVVNKIK